MNLETKEEVQGLTFDYSAPEYYTTQYELAKEFVRNPLATKTPQFPHDLELTEAMKAFKNLVSEDPLNRQSSSELITSDFLSKFKECSLRRFNLSHEITIKASEIHMKAMCMHNLLREIAGVSQAEVHASTIEVERSEQKRKKRGIKFSWWNANNLLTETNPHYRELTSAAQTFEESSYFSRKTIEAVQLCDEVKAVARAINNVFDLSGLKVPFAAQDPLRGKPLKG